MTDHAPDSSPPSPTGIPVWDLPTRLFHWLLVLLILDAWVSYKFGDPMMRWHQWNGLAILTLILYRFFWGLWGSSTARFRQFAAGPGAVIRYLLGVLRGEKRHWLGHNPAGGWSVLALLTVIGAQGVFGLFATDDVLASGPLNFLVSDPTASRLTRLHQLGFWAILALVGGHLSAVFFYLLVQNENLIRPMITGCKPPEQVPPGERAVFRSPWLALATLLLAALLAWLGISAWKWKG
ncbi:MAG: cytochrome b/b6 domain-containing protein [Magnetococcales bacterium]|nr:cytochrome b/b6 domain-containing protein [Magnetococcales bacterium]